MGTSISSKIRSYIREEIRGMYTVSYVIVEEVDYDNMEIRVSLKRDREANFWVPLASIFADGEGYGQVVPIHPDDEGLLLHTKSPIDKLTVSKGHEDDIQNQRVFDINDGLFIPMYWNDNDTKPAENFTNWEDGDYLLFHRQDSYIHIKGKKHTTDPGTIALAISNGVEIELYNEDSKEKAKVETEKLSLTLDDTAGAEKATMETSSGAGVELDEQTGGFRAYDKSGGEAKADGQGNLTFTFSGTVSIDASDIDLGSGTLAALLNENATIQYEDTGDTSDGSAGSTTKTATIADPGTDNVDGS